jgi:hypothetical protein
MVVEVYLIHAFVDGSFEEKWSLERIVWTRRFHIHVVSAPTRMIARSVEAKQVSGSFEILESRSDNRVPYGPVPGELGVSPVCRVQA